MNLRLLSFAILSLLSDFGSVRANDAACVPSVGILNCVRDEMNHRRTYYMYEEEVNIKLGCPKNKIEHINWVLIDTIEARQAEAAIHEWISWRILNLSVIKSANGQGQLVYACWKVQRHGSRISGCGELVLLRACVENNKATPFPKYLNKTLVEINRKTVSQPGEYILKVSVKESYGMESSDSCTLNYYHEPPHFIFEGGRRLRLEEGKPLSVNISKSKFIDDSAKLTWSSKCVRTSTTGKCEQARCRPVGKGLTATINNQECFSSAEFIVQMRYFPNRTVTDMQGVYFDKLNAEVDLVCDKNCDRSEAESSSPEEDVHLSIKCPSGCIDIDGKAIKWVALLVPQRSSTPLLPDPDGMSVTISKAELKRGRRYLVNAYLPGNCLIPQNTKQEASIGMPPAIYNLGKFNRTYMVQTLPMVKQYIKCSIEPKTGYALETLFKFTCVPKGAYFMLHMPFIELYQPAIGGDKLDIQLVRASYKMVFDSILDGYNKEEFPATLKVYDEYYDIDRPLRLKVKMQYKEVDEKYINTLLDRAEMFGHHGHNYATNEILRGVKNRLTGTKLSEKATVEAYIRFADILRQTAINTLYDYQYSVLTLIELLTVEEKNVTYQKALSKLCKVISAIFVESVDQAKYTDIAKKDLNYFYKEIDKCVDRTIDIDEEIESNLNQTEKEDKDTVTEPVIVDDYPDYDKLSDDLETKEKKLTAMELFAETSRLMLHSLKPGSKFPLEPHFCDRTAMKDKATKVAAKTFNVTGALVKMSSNSFEQFENNVISALVISCKRAFLDPHVIATDIVNVELYKGLINQVPISGSFNITFDMIPEEAETQSYTVTVPTDPDDTSMELNIHRINLFRGTICYVKFFNLTSEHIFQVVFTVDKRPVYEDFYGNVYKVDVDNNVLNCPITNDVKSDRFIYFAILPHQDMLKGAQGQNLSVVYEIQIFQQECLSFDIELLAWGSARCDVILSPGNDNPKVTCICNHATYFAASNAEVDNKLDEVKLVNYETELRANYVIFIHIVAVLLCYCFALVFMPLRNKTVMGRDKIIFLTDNMKNDRYGYLIIVRTGNVLYSGTTSNVVLKVYGDKSNSMPHVLNYPDPDKRLLNRDTTDWFVMTNATYLGAITELEIWIDSIGYRPSWYCESVQIVDLQVETHWFFKIDQWFSVADGKSYSAFFQPTITGTLKESLLKTLQKHVRFHKGAENTWNIFSRLEDDKLTYHQRVTIILSMIYTTYAATMVFFQIPEMTTADAYGRGSFRVHLAMAARIFGSSMIASCINFPMLYFFRNSQKVKKEYSLIIEESAFGINVTHIIWGLLCAWIVLCIMFLLYYCFWITLYTSLDWMFCTSMSLVFTALIMENIFIVGMKLLTTYLLKARQKYYDLVKIIAEIERQRKVLFKKFGELIMRPYFRQHYNKLSFETLILRKQHQKERIEVTRLFRNMCFFVILLAMLCMITFHDETQLVHVSNHETNMLASGGFVKTNMTLEKIRQESHIYQYLNETIIPSLLSKHWYEGFILNDAGLMIDFTTKLLGVVQLRQQRRAQVCELPESLLGLEIHCEKEDENPARFKGVDYQPGSNKFKATGRLETYSDAGYVIHLGRTVHNSHFVFNWLHQKQWIDINTKVLFIEYWAYNANYNVFNAVRIFIERDPTGLYVTSKTVLTFRIVHNNATLEFFIMFLVWALVLFIFMMFTNMMWDLYKRRWHYLKNLWNLIDLCVITLSLALVSVYVIRRERFETLMDVLQSSDHSTFVDFSEVVHLSQLYTNISALLLGVVIITFWKYLRFRLVFQMIERTIRETATEVGIVMFSQFYLVGCFALFYYQVMGNTVGQFSHPSRSLVSWFLISKDFPLGYNRRHLLEAGTLPVIMFVVFMLASVVMYNLYCSVLIIGFYNSKIFYSNKKKLYNLKDYLFDEVRFRTELFKRRYSLARLKAGAGDAAYKYVTPKEPAQRYADCVVMTDDKMNLMRIIAIAFIKKKNRITQGLTMRKEDDRHTLDFIKNVQYLHCEPEEDKLEQSLFFRSKDPTNNRLRFVSNLKLLQMEFVVEKMLHHERIEKEIVKTETLHVSGDADRMELLQKTAALIEKTVRNIKLDLI